ncbi:MAG: ATP-grasp domain-containing protein, partial [Acidimicrobiia bacterium]|nr:ATP-grasp domain-containing protein [Acidimicrobiia bacterium]
MSFGDDFPFRRIAIVNRGEPAMRLIRAVREINAEYGLGLKALAFYTEPDRAAMFVREADEGYSLGPATTTEEGERKHAYLNYPLLERMLRESRAEAVWAGWGFVAEHADFVELCERAGVTFIGPSADVMRRLGDKITSKQLAESSGVPVAPWSGGPVESAGAAHTVAEELGYPLMIKATAGGGGRGIRRVDGADSLDEAFASAQAEAFSAFGDRTVFLERRVSGARHIEVQIVGDAAGVVWPVGVRDCSIQRRNQKIIEEAPSPILTAEQDTFVREAAARLGASAGYVNAGTVEFLYSPEEAAFWFMEVNARLQVEHPITEVTTGLDLVKLQVDIAGGGRLLGDPPPTRGHAIEARLNAEDPENQHAPAPGAVEIFRPAGGPGIRVDTGIEEDDRVAADFDSMIAKVIGSGTTRQEAIARLDRALRETAVVIRGGASNKAFLRQLLNAPEVVDGSADVGWLDERGAVPVASAGHGEIAITQAAVESYDLDEEIERRRFASAAARGRPELPKQRAFFTELTLRGNTYECGVRRLGPRRYRVAVDGSVVDLTVEKMGRTERRLEIGDLVYRVLSVPEDDSVLIDVEGASHRVRRDLGGEVRSPSPAVVVSVPVEAGDFVTAGDRLAVLEAMKMEMTVTAPYAGRVRTVLVSPNTQVGVGMPLLILEREETGGRAATEDRLDFSALAEVGDDALRHNRCTHHLGLLEALILGYDIDVDRFEQSVQAGGLLCADALADETVWEPEAQLIQMFVDLVSLFRPEPGVDDEEGDTARRSVRDYFFDYLRDPGGRGEGLPASFVQKLRAALSHYGIESLEPKRRLRRALYRMYIAFQRLQRRPAAMMTLLEGWREAEDVALFAAEYRPLLTRLADDTRRRFPQIHAVAAEVIFEAFDRPLLDESRRAVYAAVDEQLAALAAGVSAPDQTQLLAALVACPQPLKTTLSRRFADVTPQMRRLMLEVMARRYYRMRALDELSHHEVGGIGLLRGRYPHEGTTISLIATHVDHRHLAGAVEAVTDLIQQVPEGDDIVVDFYGWRDDASDDTALTAEAFAALLDAAEFGRPLRRVVLAVSAESSGPGMAGVEQYTFRPSGSGMQEEREIRGLHPMMGKRLEVWRLSNFNLSRLPSGDDVYLFRGTARDNPQDERIFALAEVRDLTAVRDDDRHMIGLPYLERVFADACMAIRRYQASLPPRHRPVWNRILLYVWPVIDLEPDEMGLVVTRLAPVTEGLGIEKVVVRTPNGAGPSDRVPSPEFEILNPEGTGVAIRVREPRFEPLEPLDAYTQKVVRLRGRGITYPYELISMIAPSDGDAGGFPRGTFVEYDLAASESGGNDTLEPVDRPPGENTANIVVGEVTSFTPKHPEG